MQNLTCGKLKPMVPGLSDGSSSVVNTNDPALFLTNTCLQWKTATIIQYHSDTWTTASITREDHSVHDTCSTTVLYILTWVQVDRNKMEEREEL